MTKCLKILYFTLLASCVSGQQFHPVRKIQDPPLFISQLNFTASILNTKGSHLRVLIYGQSISVQTWWYEVKTYFEKKYPQSTFTFANKAIGGFSSERLKLTVENDVVSFYPDLILFHDYGNEEDYERIIQIMKGRTTADIVVQTDHMAEQNQEWHDEHSNVWLPNLCKKYGLGLVDIRKEWKNYLRENNLQIRDLLVDGVHLNDHGNYLMAEIMKAYFSHLKYNGTTTGRITKLKKNKDFVIKESTIEITLTGNRVDIKSDIRTIPEKVDILVDGKPSKEIPQGYYYTRPTLKSTGEFLTKMGSLISMKISGQVQEENWNLTVLSVDSVTQEIAFELHGAETGMDGKGTNTQSFISDSGKITIHPQDWFIRRHEGDFSQYGWLKTGDVLQWRTAWMGSQPILNTRPDITTLIQGMTNSKHTIKITGPGVAYINEIIVYSPEERD